ncbi:hypothetical protein NicSoilC12_30340 [Arthrobacter sp. NicSoilC12]|nr:hypothetical protein NicSoilC12_30340 [Arthrobacter sp. NicSoilC12]
MLTLKPLTDADVEGLLLRAATDDRGLGGKVELSDEALATSSGSPAGTPAGP